MWSSWAENATKGLTDALERTGDALTKAATKAARQHQQEEQDAAAGGKSGEQETDKQATTATDNNNSTDHHHNNIHPGSEVMGKGLELAQLGWTSFMETTKRTVDATRQVVEREQHRLHQQLQEFNKGGTFYKRDASLPLDVAALRDAQVVYVTDRIVTMSHPAIASANDAIDGPRKLAAVSHLLQKRHAGKYLVWNLSEVEYDISILDDQVLAYSFPGSPSPPLGLLLKLLMSLESWLKADAQNVAVIHCLTGKGRTSTVLAAFLCWMGEAGFGDILKALRYIAECKNCTVEELTIPSQRRYASYFTNMLDGIRPSQPPLILKRVIMSEAPRYSKGPPRKKMDGSNQEEEDDDKLFGCAPYLQLFKAGQLLFTTAASLHYEQTPDDLPFVQVADGSVFFPLDKVVQGDILVRCRHLEVGKKKPTRISMFRAAFHTGYVPPNVMRLTKLQLDGACGDSRFPDDFFVDLIFEKADAETTAKHLEGNTDEKDSSHEKETTSEENDKEDKEENKNDEDKKKQEEEKPEPDTSKKANKTVSATSYDTMLHRDSRFWDVIAARRQEQQQQAQQAQTAQSNAETTTDQQTGEKPNDKYWGPTIGRRRTFVGEEEEEEKKKQQEQSDKTTKKPSSLETFSIGGELDFLPESPTAAKATIAKIPPKRDSLMEALMALDEDATDANNNKETTKQETKTDKDESGANNNKEDQQPKSSNMDEENMQALLEDADLDVDDDVNALLGDGNVSDLDDDDDDDDDLEDLENLLSRTK